MYISVINKTITLHLYIWILRWLLLRFWCAFVSSKTFFFWTMFSLSLLFFPSQSHFLLLILLHGKTSTRRTPLPRAIILVVFWFLQECIYCGKLERVSDKWQLLTTGGVSLTVRYWLPQLVISLMSTRWEQDNLLLLLGSSSLSFT